MPINFLAGLSSPLLSILVPFAVVNIFFFGQCLLELSQSLGCLLTALLQNLYFHIEFFLASVHLDLPDLLPECFWEPF